MNKFRTKILTEDKVIFDLDVVYATLPIQNGLVTILSNHIPYLGVLAAGEIILSSNKSKKEFYLNIKGGIVSFNNNQLIILADKTSKESSSDDLQVRETNERIQKLKDEREEDTVIAQTEARLEKGI
jgi:F0F1-type ATP synthase epsilon subunit